MLLGMPVTSRFGVLGNASFLNGSGDSQAVNPLLGGASRKPPSKTLPCQNTKWSGPHRKPHCPRDKTASKANPNPEPSPAPSCRKPGSEISRDTSATGQNQPRCPPSPFPFQSAAFAPPGGPQQHLQPRNAGSEPPHSFTSRHPGGFAADSATGGGKKIG